MDDPVRWLFYRCGWCGAPSDRLACCPTKGTSQVTEPSIPSTPQ